jgi:hypothetical protein
MPDRIDAAMNQPKPPNRDPVVDFVIRQPETPQLLARDHAPLPPRKVRDRMVDGTRRTFAGTIAVNVRRVAHAPELPPGRVTAPFAL